VDKTIKNKERELEIKKIDSEIAQERATTEERRALEREAKQKYGKDWRKILGMLKIKTDQETIQDLYVGGLGHLRELNNPRRFRE